MTDTPIDSIEACRADVRQMFERKGEPASDDRIDQVALVILGIRTFIATTGPQLEAGVLAPALYIEMLNDYSSRSFQTLRDLLGDELCMRLFETLEGFPLGDPQEAERIIKAQLAHEEGTR